MSCERYFAPDVARKKPKKNRSLYSASSVINSQAGHVDSWGSSYSSSHNSKKDARKQNPQFRRKPQQKKKTLSADEKWAKGLKSTYGKMNKGKQGPVGNPDDEGVRHIKDQDGAWFGSRNNLVNNILPTPRNISPLKEFREKTLASMAPRSADRPKAPESIRVRTSNSLGGDDLEQDDLIILPEEDQGPFVRKKEVPVHLRNQSQSVLAWDRTPTGSRSSSRPPIKPDTKLLDSMNAGDFRHVKNDFEISQEERKQIMTTTSRSSFMHPEDAVEVLEAAEKERVAYQSWKEECRNRPSSRFTSTVREMHSDAKIKAN